MPRRTSRADGFDCVALQGDWPLAIGDAAVVAEPLASRVVARRGRLGEPSLAEADLVVDGVARDRRPAGPARRGRRPGSTRSPRRLRRRPSTCRRARTRPGERATDDGVFADETVTFGVAKPVHLLPATEAAVGRLTVIDIGLERGRAPPTWSGSTSPTCAALWPVPGAADDKYSRGVLGVVAGGEAYTGAAVLCCTAAVGAGVGMVRYVGTPTPTGLAACRRPRGGPRRGRVQAWVVGPGLDTALARQGRQGPARRRPRRARLRPAGPVDAGGLDLVDGPRSGAHPAHAPRR